jgi:Protein of unknown function (DUF1329)
MFVRCYIATLFFTVIATGSVCAATEGQDPIQPGTVITLQNWQSYRQYMTEGMQALFAGRYFWKLPPDASMEVGQPKPHPLPQVFLDNTKKYSHLVQIRDLPNGGHTIVGYVAGRPFPDPVAPMKGYKILVDLWYRYSPYLTCGDDAHQYVQDESGSTSRSHNVEVDRRLSYISDPGQPIDDQRSAGYYRSEYSMTLEPEQQKYTTVLTLYPRDPSKLEDQYIFLPQLRRVLRQSANARCSPVGGGDFAVDDFEGFNGGIARFQSDYLRDQPILTVVDSGPEAYGNLSNYDSLFFPKPEVGKWQLRDTYVIDVRRIPSEQKGYCYGKQILYVDKDSDQVLWKDGYDPEMKFVKIGMSSKIATPVPQEGLQVGTGNEIEIMWDVQKNHASLYLTAGPSGKGLVANDQCRNLDGENYDVLKRYSTPAGLTEVMR